MKRNWMVLSAALLALVLIAGFTTAATVPGITDTQVLIGAFQDQSGPASVVGINMRKGMRHTSTGSTPRAASTDVR